MKKFSFSILFIGLIFSYIPVSSSLNAKEERVFFKNIRQKIEANELDFSLSDIVGKDWDSLFVETYIDTSVENCSPTSYAASLKLKYDIWDQLYFPMIGKAECSSFIILADNKKVSKIIRFIFSETIIGDTMYSLPKHPINVTNDTNDIYIRVSDVKDIDPSIGHYKSRNITKKATLVFYSKKEN
ncbi:MAG: hypothetical protein OEY94_10215 [Alphaproteobacteria bacterium]|nr:hypothetical protein [Alphaproteobacteria bacterium]